MDVVYAEDMHCACSWRLQDVCQAVMSFVIAMVEDPDGEIDAVHFGQRDGLSLTCVCISFHFIAVLLP